jgi:hypothetical protein
MVAKSEQLSRPSLVEGILCDIRQMDDPNDQLKAFIHPSNTPWSGYHFPDEISASDFDALIDFAADETGSASLVVRAQALEVAIDRLEWSTREGQPDRSDGLRSRHEDVTTLIPDYKQKSIEARCQFPEDKDMRWYRKAATRLIRREGLCEEEYMYPHWEDFSGDHLEMPSQTPAVAFMLLDRISELSKSGESLPMSNLARLAPLALDINDVVKDVTISIEDDKRGEIESRARICRIIGYGEDHQEELERFIQSGSKEVDIYTTELNELYDATKGLKSIFPPEYADGVEKGAQELIANSVYAVKQHLENERSTSAKLPLGDREDGLSLELEGSEPLEVLRALKQSMQTLSNIVTSPEMVTTPVTKATDYRLYRLLDNSGHGQASVYIRPWGADIFDQRMEYGRVGEGVEASISFVVDAKDPVKLLRPGKLRRNEPTDDRISIRLDREGVHPDQRGQKGASRDPTTEHGTLSLDVGSVIGNDEWLGTKIGRLLAWGNHLRSQRVGVRTGLNHVTHYFSPKDGQAAVFAARASRLAEGLEQRQLATRDLVTRFSGFIAVR